MQLSMLAFACSALLCSSAIAQPAQEPPALAQLQAENAELRHENLSLQIELAQWREAAWKLGADQVHAAAEQKAAAQEQAQKK
jgi:hypothetical protein